MGGDRDARWKGRQQDVLAGQERVCAHSRTVTFLPGFGRNESLIWYHRDIQAGAVPGLALCLWVWEETKKSTDPVSLSLSSCSILLAPVPLSPIPSVPCSSP